MGELEKTLWSKYTVKKSILPNTSPINGAIAAYYGTATDDSQIPLNCLVDAAGMDRTSDCWTSPTYFANDANGTRHNLKYPYESQIPSKFPKLDLDNIFKGMGEWSSHISILGTTPHGKFLTSYRFDDVSGTGVWYSITRNQTEFTIKNETTGSVSERIYAASFPGEVIPLMLICNIQAGGGGGAGSDFAHYATGGGGTGGSFGCFLLDFTQANPIYIYLGAPGYGATGSQEMPWDASNCKINYRKSQAGGATIYGGYGGYYGSSDKKRHDPPGVPTLAAGTNYLVMLYGGQGGYAGAIGENGGNVNPGNTLLANNTSFTIGSYHSGGKGGTGAPYWSGGGASAYGDGGNGAYGGDGSNGGTGAGGGGGSTTWFGTHKGGDGGGSYFALFY